MKAVLGLVSIRSGVVRLNGEDITGQPPHRLVQRGVGFVPQTNNVFPSLTVRENLEMGCFVNPKSFDERYEVVTGLFPRLAERADPARRIAVGWRTTDGGDGPCADARSRSCCCSTSRRQACRRSCRTRCSCAAS